jgi:hypothetical protein
MTEEMQTHQALLQFMLLYGRKKEIKAMEYWGFVESIPMYRNFLKNNLIYVTNPTGTKIICIHITKKGMQYLKRNPYKHSNKVHEVQLC